MNHQRNPKLKQPVFFKSVMVMKDQKNKQTKRLGNYARLKELKGTGVILDQEKDIVGAIEGN